MLASIPCVFDDDPNQAAILSAWLDKPVLSSPKAFQQAALNAPVVLADAHSYLRYRLTYPAPPCPVVWMTVSPVVSLLRLAIAHNVTTILPRQPPLNLNFWQRALAGAAEKRLPPEALIADGAKIDSWIIQDSAGILDGYHRMRAFFEQHGARHLNDLATVYLEAATNSVYHAIKTPEGHDLFDKGSYIEGLPAEYWVQVSLWQDAEKAGLIIRDNGGTIKMADALYWLDRHTRGAGQLDVHGRGFFLMRLLTDGFALNVKPGEYSELMAWQYHNACPHPNKPLLLMQA